MRQGDWSFETGLRCARELLALPWPPTAIVASCDDEATGVIQAIWERGWRCPQDVSVVGFDDNPIACQICPPLTTVRQPIYEIATTAMSILIEKLIPDSCERGERDFADCIGGAAFYGARQTQLARDGSLTLRQRCLS